MRKRTRHIDRWNIFIRCFVIQASWNFKSLLGLGFCFCTIPLARRLFKTPQERSSFLRRHLEFFNSHPYYATWCLGAVTRLEEEAIEKRWPDKHPISLFKNRMTGPLGSLGDQMFWSRVKPLFIAVALCLAMLIGWFAIPIFLILYNIPHFNTRIKGMKLSYQLGFDVINVMAKKHPQKYFSVISALGLIVTGILVMLAADYSLGWNLSVFAAFWGSSVIALILIQLKKSINWVISATVISSLLIGWLFTL